MRLKQGVCIKGIKSETIIAITIVNSIFLAHGKECIITSVMDGKHKEGSLHYKGQAVDFRTKHLNMEEKVKITNEIGIALGDDFDTVLEYVGLPNEHLHVEYDPK